MPRFLRSMTILNFRYNNKCAAETLQYCTTLQHRKSLRAVRIQNRNADLTIKIEENGGTADVLPLTAKSRFRGIKLCTYSRRLQTRVELYLIILIISLLARKLLLVYKKSRTNCTSFCAYLEDGFGPSFEGTFF